MKTLKWFFVIFFAVFFANIASNFATAALTMAGVKAVFETIMPAKAQPATVRVANPLKPGQTDKEALCESWHTLYTDSPKTPFRIQMEQACKSVYGQSWVYGEVPEPRPEPAKRMIELDPAYKEQLRAQENDLRLCRSWMKIHAKEPTETYRMHMNSACKRAYGDNWTGR